MADLQDLAALVSLSIVFVHTSHNLASQIIHPAQSSLVRAAVQLLIVLWTGRNLTFIYVRLVGKALGWYLRRRTALRTQMILSRIGIEEHSSGIEGGSEYSKQEANGTTNSDKNGSTSQNVLGWKGIIGFFHPFW